MFFYNSSKIQYFKIYEVTNYESKIHHNCKIKNSGSNVAASN